MTGSTIPAAAPVSEAEVALAVFAELSFSFDGFSLEPATLLFRGREIGLVPIAVDHDDLQRAIDVARGAAARVCAAQEQGAEPVARVTNEMCKLFWEVSYDAGDERSYRQDAVRKGLLAVFAAPPSPSQPAAREAALYEAADDLDKLAQELKAARFWMPARFVESKAAKFRAFADLGKALNE